MTHGGGNAINLATMWVPVMPDTAHFDAAVRDMGSRGKRILSEQLGQGGDELGNKFANQFVNSLSSRLRGADLGLGVGGLIDQVGKLGEQVDAKLGEKLKAKLPQAYKEATLATNEYAQALTRLNPVQERHSQLTSEVTAARAAQDVAWVKARESIASVNDQTAIANRTAEEQNSILERNHVIVSEAVRLQSVWENLRKEQIENTRQLNVEEERIAPVRAKAAAAQENYTNIVQKHSEATSHAVTMSNMLAGAMGGAVVLGIQGVVSGFESIIELGEHVFEGAVEGATELGKKLVEIGEDYAHLSIQVSEFSGATGDGLDKLQASAARVFGTLDVEGKNTGETLAVLSGRLGLTGDALETLTSHVERLQGRFKDLKTTDVATAFSALGVSGADADNVLDSWVESARNAGESTGQLISQLAQLGDTLRPEVTDLTPEQLGHWIAEINEKVPNAQKVVMGLSKAEAAFAKDNISFAEGMKRAAQDINSAATEADKEAIAEKLFGTRAWSGALDAINMYHDASSNAFKGNGNDLDDLLNKWSDLENQIDAFKHKVEGALAPFGAAATGLIEEGLNKVSGWFETHETGIIEGIRKWGHEFINNIPEIQDFAATFVSIMGPVADALQMMAVYAMQLGAGILIATTHVKDGLAMWDASQKLLKQDPDKFFGGIADKIRALKPPLDDFNDGLDTAANSAEALRNNMSALTPGPAGMPLGGTGNGWWWGSPRGTTTTGGGVGSGAGGPMGPATVQGPHGPIALPAPGMPGAQVPSVHGGVPLLPGAPQGTGGPGNATGGGPNDVFGQDQPSSFATSGASYPGGVNWPAIAGAESSGDWRIDHGEGNDVTGAFQISTPTWLSHGGGQYAPKAYMASPEAQLTVAEAILADPAQGPTAWPQTFRNHPEWFGSYASQAKGVQRGGTAAGFDGGGWTDHAKDALKWLGDDMLTAGALGLKAAGIGGKFLAKAAGPVGLAGPLIGESISPSAHTATAGADTMPFNPGRRKGFQGGGRPTSGGAASPSVPGGGHQMRDGTTNIPWNSDAFARSIWSPHGYRPPANDDHRMQLPFAGHDSFGPTHWPGKHEHGKAIQFPGFDGGGFGGGYGDPGHDYVHEVSPGGADWEKMTLAQQNLASWIGMNMFGIQKGGRAPGFTEGGEIPMPPWTPEKIARLHEIATEQTGIAYQGEGKQRGGGWGFAEGGDVLTPSDASGVGPNPGWPTGIPDWWHPDATKLQRMAGLGGWDDEPSIGGPGDKSRIWWHSPELQPKFHGPGAYAKGGMGNDDTRKSMKHKGIDWKSPLGPLEWLMDKMAGGYEAGGRGPKDVLPVWVTPNEYIWNEEAVSKYGPLIHGLNEEAQGRGSGMSTMFRNAKGFQGGGPGGDGAAAYAASGRGNDMPELVDPQLQYVMGIANNMGLTLTAGKSGHGTHDIDQGWHDSGQAGDFGNGRDTPEETAFAQLMFEHFGSQLSELIYAGPGMPKLIKDGQAVDPGFYGADTLAGHHDHVHVAIKATQTLSDSMSPGSEPLVMGGPGGFGATPMSFGGGGGGFSASPAGWGGGSGFGGGGPGSPGFPTDPSQMTPQQFQLYEEQRSRQKDVRSHSEKLDTLNAEKKQLEEVEIPQKTKELEDEKKLGVAGDPAKIDQLTAALQKLNERLTKITGTELPDAAADLKDAQYKANQPYKTPGGNEQPDDGAKAFGSKFLGGIAQSLGFPDVFGGKAPWDFGAVKMLGRFATGFFNGMQKEQQGGMGGGQGYGSGQSPMTGAGGDLLGGLASGAGGFKLPEGLGRNGFQGGVPQISGAAPNIAPPSAGSQAHIGAGAPPGPPGAAPAGFQGMAGPNITLNNYGNQSDIAALQSWQNGYRGVGGVGQGNPSLTAAAPAALPTPMDA